MKYLGHVVSTQGVGMDPEKIIAISELGSTKNLKEVQAFLGTMGYYRQYLGEFAMPAKPLTVLTGNGVPWE